ncbi:hypothetical protein [Myxococcus sp. RHSTA-1-4]|uniref:hypothetical protein n=1 Tax=Myxococcus sp. RHSTA-1-4 TaxID=2874601 RepID=UPI001CBCB5D2|nr:hypothetical protein [Myxococcus sp. RHSTA-1-4]MBZ4418630.1 hypothetical protein [Myxococcus sp. RHSTA-1-4]
MSRIAGRLFMTWLRVSARAARSPRWQRVAEWTLGQLGRAVARRRGLTEASSPQALGEQWQRIFPSRRHVPLVGVDATTAYAEIRTVCPLRGTGDVHACHRLMAYDRAAAARMGARFVVLESQATPGATVCRVALRRQELPADDLVAAHERSGRKGTEP